MASTGIGRSSGSAGGRGNKAHVAQEQRGLRPRPTGQQKPPPPTGSGSASQSGNDK